MGIGRAWLIPRPRRPGTTTRSAGGWRATTAPRPACGHRGRRRGRRAAHRLPPGGAGEDELEPIDWDTWFEKFDEAGLTFLYQAAPRRVPGDVGGGGPPPHHLVRHVPRGVRGRHAAPRIFVLDRFPGRRDVRPVAGHAEDHGRVLCYGVPDRVRHCQVQHHLPLPQDELGRHHHGDGAVASGGGQVPEGVRVDEGAPLRLVEGAVPVADEHAAILPPAESHVAATLLVHPTCAATSPSPSTWFPPSPHSTTWTLSPASR